ncbi:MAG: orotidine-5'-phosphate decarboxylase [Lachnospiraceae bacterium]|nr:orotidine-5'-phosphate decarboxylase [Lachnospiraceae bacterium]
MIDRLIERIQELQAPVVAGLDPNLQFVPDSLKEKAYKEYGETLEGAAEAVWEFNKAIIDSIADIVPAVKPQIAMYEQFGIPGMVVFDRTVRYCKEKGLSVIGDIKRGDIGSTSEAYARGHIGKVQVGNSTLRAFDEDFITVNPYMGTDCVEPFLKVAKEDGKGLFVLIKTSNPSSGEFQDRLIDGRPLFEHVAEKVNKWGEGLNGKYGYGPVGAVVGATYPQQAAAIRKLIPNAYILVPGYGAQGATAKDILPNFNSDGLGAIVNSSRGIIAAYRNKAYSSYGPDHFAEAARASALDMIADIRSALKDRS